MVKNESKMFLNIRTVLKSFHFRHFLHVQKMLIKIYWVLINCFEYAYLYLELTKKNINRILEQESLLSVIDNNYFNVGHVHPSGFTIRA